MKKKQITWENKTYSKDNFCDNCFYWMCIGNNESRCCHYILITGKKRPCDPGKGCTVKAPIKVNRRKRKE